MKVHTGPKVSEIDGHDNASAERSFMCVCVETELKSNTVKAVLESVCVLPDLYIYIIL